MQLSTLYLSLLLCSVVLAVPLEELFERKVGGKCSSAEGKGTCISPKKCKGISYAYDLCPKDSDNVQTCPGGKDIQCCIKGKPSQKHAEGGKKGGKKGARKEKGTKYVWGGGSCKGPTGGGYDCSGLLGYAVCKATGKNIFSAGVRVTGTMYCSSKSKLKSVGAKRVRFSKRRAGDAVFFGPDCGCGNPKGIHHVGIMANSGTKMVAAPYTGAVVREESFKKSKACPYVVRFG
ncbi:hypothetical protein FQN53_002025 [Emmonsiellopsis sp. PD_33]|nr:hypothetical protein FQN53_002025 [Emmonsiellopsis sp. PD_33]